MKNNVPVTYVNCIVNYEKKSPEQNQNQLLLCKCVNGE